MTLSYELLATWLRARSGDAERGSSLVEYALLVALIAVTCVIVIDTLGQESGTSLSRTGSALAGA